LHTVYRIVDGILKYSTYQMVYGIPLFIYRKPDAIPLKESPLSQRYAVPVLVALLEKKCMRKYDLTEVISNGSTIDKILRILEEAGLVTLEERVEGRRTIRVCLTEKGIEVAKHLRNAEKLLD
jgi:predicted transcriptional regulator